jgi:sortase A
MSRRGSAQLLLLFFRSRSRLGWWMGGIALVLLLAVLLQVAGEFPLMTRTGPAQLLRQSAWQHALAGLPEQAPWPWANDAPLVTASWVPRLGLSASVGTHSESDPANSSIIEPIERTSAEDPHLSPKELSDISSGDRITVTSADGSSRVYRVTGRRVVDPHLSDNEPRDSDDDSTLASCPRLDRALADTLRLVIQATRVGPATSPQPLPEQRL